MLTGGLQISSKMVWPNSWIVQIVRQWIPDCRTSRSEGAAADMLNSQLMAYADEYAQCLNRHILSFLLQHKITINL